MAKGIFTVLVAAAASVAISVALESSSAKTKFLNTCRDDGLDSRNALNRLKESGILFAEERRSDEILRLYIVDHKWHSMADHQRVELAYHGYCLVSDSSGRGTVLVKSQNSQRVLYSVVGGYPQSHAEKATTRPAGREKLSKANAIGGY